MRTTILLILYVVLFHGPSVTSAQDIHASLMGICDVTTSYEVNEEAIHVEWNTNREVNLRFFMLQQSTDGNNYDVATIVAARNSYTRPSHYQYEDTSTFPDSVAVVTYRLLAIDMDGRRNLLQEWPVKLGNAEFLSKK